MPTVLHVASVFPSNSNRLALQFGYVSDSWSIELLHLTARREEIGRAANNIDRVHLLPHVPCQRKGDYYLVRKIRSLIRRVVDSIALYATLIRSDADILHAHENSSLWALAFWLLVLRKSAVWDPHDYFHEPGDAKSGQSRLFLLGVLERAVVKRGTPILAVSEGMRTKYADRFPHADIQIIRNYSSQRSVDDAAHDSVDENASDQVALRNRIGAGTIRLVYPGLIKPERFSLRLIERLGSIEGISLDIYGEDRSGRATHQDELSTMLSDLSIENVRLCGSYTPDSIVSILTEYHFAIFPYQVTHPNIDFCLPNKFFQCIEAGLPMISTDMKEMGGIISRFELGYVFPSENYLKCADILTKDCVLDESYLTLVRNVLTYRAGHIDYERQRSILLDTYTAAIQRK